MFKLKAVTNGNRGKWWYTVYGTEEFIFEICLYICSINRKMYVVIVPNQVAIIKLILDNKLVFLTYSEIKKE